MASQTSSKWRQELRDWAFVMHKDTTMKVAGVLAFGGLALAKLGQKIGRNL